MAKDPAFLFYSQDFFVGTATMSFEDRGKYITLLCMMHQQGRMSEETIRLLVGSVSVSLKSKFSVDENGLWFNERLEIEAEKRAKFTESRRSNGSLGGRPKANAKPNGYPIGKATDNLPENENILSKEIVSKEKKRTTLKEKSTKVDFSVVDDLIPPGWPQVEFKSVFKEFWDMRIAKNKPLTENAVKRRINQLYELSGGSYQLAEKICLRSTDARWDEFYPLHESQKQKSNGKLVRDQA